METNANFEETLKEKCERLRGVTNYKLDPLKPVLIMIDGRSFSKNIKNKFKLPFDDEFIHIMNEVACYCCKNIQGCKFAYSQSDEISFYIDCRSEDENYKPTMFFDGRLNKILPVIASMASSKFNQLITKLRIGKLYGKTEGYIGQKEINELLDSLKLAEFDCKAWNVDNNNDVYAWFLYRQLDCIRNSKQQAAQKYISQEKLSNKNTDEQIQMLFEQEGISWEKDYDDGKKYGRFIYKEEFLMTNEYGTFTRTKWTPHLGYTLSTIEGHNWFLKLNNLEG